MKNEKEMYESNDQAHTYQGWRERGKGYGHSVKNNGRNCSRPFDRSKDRTNVCAPTTRVDEYCKTRPSFANAWIMDTCLIREEALAWVRSIHPLGGGYDRGGRQKWKRRREKEGERGRIHGASNYLSARRSKLNKRRIFHGAYPPHWRCAVAIPRSMNHYYRSLQSVIVAARCFLKMKKLIRSANINGLITSHCNDFLNNFFGNFEIIAYSHY